MNLSFSNLFKKCFLRQGKIISYVSWLSNLHFAVGFQSVSELHKIGNVWKRCRQEVRTRFVLCSSDSVRDSACCNLHITRNYNLFNDSTGWVYNLHGYYSSFPGNSRPDLFQKYIHSHVLNQVSLIT